MGKETQEKAKLTITPNPASNKLTITTGRQDYKPPTISIYNSIGINVFSNDYDAGADNITIDISGFSPGVYFVSYSSCGCVVYDKFVVVR